MVWDRRATLALVVGVLHLLMYALWVPPWLFPDEPRHFAYVRLVSEHGGPVSSRDIDLSLEATIIHSMARFDFWRFGFVIGGYVQHRDQQFAELWGRQYSNMLYQPPLYYLLAGLTTGFFPRSALLSQLLAVRLLSVVLAAFSLGVIYLTGRALGDAERALGMLIFAALLPGHAFINASVNNDVLAELLALVAVLGGISAVMYGPRPTVLMVTLLSTLAALFTKRTTWFLLLYVPLAFAIAWGRRRFTQHRPSRLVLGSVVALVVLGIPVVAAWRLGVLGIPLPKKFGTLLAQGAFWESARALPLQRHLTFLFQSFWGRFGWLNVPLPAWTYTVLLAATLAAGVAWGCMIWDVARGRRTVRPEIKLVGALLFLAVLNQWALVVGKEIVYAFFGGESVPQGRYLYPLLSVYALFYVEGWRWWLRRMRLRPLPVITAFMLALSWLALWILARFYYGG